MATNRLQNPISISSTGSGSHTTRGSSGGVYRRRGISKGVFDTKRQQRLLHISKKDGERITSVLEDALKPGSKFSKGISRRTARKAKSTLYQDYKEGNISKQDYETGKKMVDSVSYRAYLEKKKASSASTTPPVTKKPRERVVNFSTDKKPVDTNRAELARQKHIIANISLDITDELAAEERGEKTVTHDPRSVLGKAENITKKQATKSKDTIAKRGNISDKNSGGVIELDIG